MEKGKREEHTWERTRRTFPPKPLMGTWEGLILVFLYLQDPKIGVLKVGRLGWEGALQGLPFSWKEGSDVT